MLVPKVALVYSVTFMKIGKKVVNCVLGMISTVIVISKKSKDKSMIIDI